MISELSALTKKKKSVTECNKTSVTECTKNLDQVSENFSNSNPSCSEVVKKSPTSSKIEKNSPFKDVSTIMKNSGHWNPQSKNLKPKKLYEGKLKGSNLISVAKLSKPAEAFISRFKPDTSTLEIESFAKTQFSHAISILCTKLNTKYDSYSSFHITLTGITFSESVNPENWPEGVLVKRFLKKSKADHDSSK